MPKKINILHINNSNVLSQYLLSIARLHDKNRYNLTIGCFDVYGPVNEELQKMGVNTFNIPVKKQSPFFYFLKIFTLYKFLKKNEIQILHLHTFFPSFFGVIAGKMAGVEQIIMTRHHANSHILLKKRIHTKIDSWTAKNCNKVIAVSEFTKKIMVNYESIPPQKIKVIHNGIEPLKTTPTPKEYYFKEFRIDAKSTVFISISRLDPDKSLETALKALKTLNEKGFPSVLLIAGAGIGNNYHKYLRQLAEEWGIKDNVIFLGFRNDIGNLLQFSDALIHPSLFESFGFCVLEAMSLGKPVFVSDIEALKEVATDSVGIFFETKNDVQLSQMLMDWLTHKEAYSGKLIKGLERSENHFTFMMMMNNYETYYEEK